MNEFRIVGIDLAKSSFNIHECTSRGGHAIRSKKTRSQLSSFLAKMPQTIVFMEACGGANYWARKAQSFGHTVKLIAPQYVKPYVKGRQKNDSVDAEAICEAGSRDNMRFVAVKSVSQQDQQLMHRIRRRYVENRTALYNQMGSILLEYGIAARKGMSHLRKVVASVTSGDDADIDSGDLSPMMKGELTLLLEEAKNLDKKIDEYDKKIATMVEQDDRCMRLMGLPGVGPITASAMVAAVGNASEFKNSRQLSAWLGLVPRQQTTGGKTRLLGLSKTGDKYLRMLLIHGARAVLMNAGKKSDPRSLWAEKLKARVGMNKAAVAMANKNARTIWSILSRGIDYDPNYRPKVSASSEMKPNRKKRSSPPVTSPSLAAA
jgi:transposase